jgi:hypothetical protein
MGSNGQLEICGDSVGSDMVELEVFASGSMAGLRHKIEGLWNRGVCGECRLAWYKTGINTA